MHLGWGAMTNVIDMTQINEALVLVEQGLGDMQNRELVSTDEVADLLLDIRGLLVLAAAETEMPEPVA